MPPARDPQGRFVGPGAKPKRLARAATKSVVPATIMVEAATGPSEPFLNELQASWARHGAATIEKVRNDRPHDYLRLMASSLAKLTDGEADAIESMSDDEVAEELHRVLDRLGARGSYPGAGVGAAEEA